MVFLFKLLDLESDAYAGMESFSFTFTSAATNWNVSRIAMPLLLSCPSLKLYWQMKEHNEPNEIDGNEIGNGGLLKYMITKLIESTYNTN